MGLVHLPILAPWGRSSTPNRKFLTPHKLQWVLVFNLPLFSAGGWNDPEIHYIRMALNINLIFRGLVPGDHLATSG